MTIFFWLKNKDQLTVENNVLVYRFNRVPFGIMSSPFLLAATVDHHLIKYESPASETIGENIYVDKVIPGKDTIKETVNFYTEAKQIFTKASMNLHDWISNDKSVMKEIAMGDRANQGPMKILGLTWVVESDRISLNRQKQIHTASNITKREIVKQIFSVYDLLGLFSPVTLQGNMYLQALWNKKLAWDDPLPTQDEIKWLKIDKDLEKLSYCDIPRYIGLEGSDKPTSQLLVFSDASKYAYAATVYLRQRTGHRYTKNLIFSKARLAPNQGVSIPRLELLQH